MKSTESKFLRLAKQLEGIIPDRSIEQIVEWLLEYRIHLKITPRRKSKYGDFQGATFNSPHKISVNGDLNPYSFLIVLVHEMAHLFTYETYRHDVKPHGKEWKHNFLKLMIPFFHAHVFPPELELAVKKSMLNPGASGCVDEELFKALRVYDENKSGELVENLRINELFAMPDGKVYRKGKKLRKRYRCVEVNTNDVYLFSPVAEVMPLEDYET